MKKLIVLLVFMASGMSFAQDFDVYLDSFMRTFPYIVNGTEYSRNTRGSMIVRDASNNVLINLNKTYETNGTGVFEDPGPIISARTSSPSINFNGTFRVDTSPMSFNQTDSGMINTINSTGSLSMTFGPVGPMYFYEALIYYVDKMSLTQPALNSTECYDTVITLSENSGRHPSPAYKWQYRGPLAGDQWEYFSPGSSFELPTRDVSLADLYPNPNDLSERIGQPIQFRVQNALNNYESNPITYTWFDCPPEFDNVSTTSTTCYENSNDGSATLTFKEDINSGFEIRYFVYQGDPSEFPIGNLGDERPPDAYKNVRLSALVDNGDGTYSGTTADDLEPGPYYVVYQEVFYDPNGIDVTVTSGAITPRFTVDNPSRVAIMDISLIEPSCSITTTGSAIVNVVALSGQDFETGTYMYSRDDGATWQTSPTFENLTQGSPYTFRVKLVFSVDSECISTDSELRTISEVTNILTVNNGSGALSPTNDSSEDGELYIRVDGGTPDFTFELYNSLNPTILLQSAIVTSAPNNEYTFEGLDEGTYFSIIKDANCEVTSENYVLEAAPTPQLGTPAVTPISCSNANDATITINATYPEPTTFFYELRVGTTVISNGNIASNATTPSEQDITISNVQPGTYSLFVRASAGDFASVAVPEIINPGPITATITPEPFTCSDSTDGAINIVASGATNYEYELSTNRGVWTNLVGSTISVSDPNFYEVTLRDRDNPSCVSSVSNRIEVIRPAEIWIVEIMLNHQNVSTSGGNNGTLEIQVDGGTPNYMYQWTRSDTFDSAKVPFTPPAPNSTDTYLSDIIAGFYQVTITDSNTCMANSEQIEITEPGPLEIQSFTGTNISCNGLNDGTLMAAVQGSLPVTYTWLLVDGSPNGTVIASETNSSNSATLTGLPPGTYRVSVQDADTGPLFNTTNVIIEEPTVISATTTLTPSCSAIANGTITISGVTGGTLDPIPNYTYSIDNGANFQNSNTFTNVAAGDNIVIVAEDGGCTYTETVIITAAPPITLNEANSIITDVSAQGLFDGSIEPVFDGGFGNLSYVWAGPSVGGITDQSIFNLGPGTYSVTVTDDNGCTLVQPFDITEPGPLSIVINEENDVSCFDANDGSITTTVTGEAPITYTWTEVGVGPLTTMAEDDIENLPPGTYTLTVEDASTTPAVTSAEIIITEPNALTAQAFATDILCAGESNGSILVTASEGTPTYEYSIDGGVIYQTNNIFPNLTAGNFTIRARDANGCTFDVQTTIIEPLPIDINIDLQQPLSAAGAEDGAISITAFGGTGNLTYSWAGPAGSYDPSSPTISNLAGGDYVITITDENYNPINPNACSFVSETITIAEPGELTASIAQTVLLECNGDDFVEITANVQGGITPYTFEWFQIENGSNTVLNEDTEILGNLSAGEYFLRVTDANTITVDATSVIIAQPDLLEIIVDSFTNVLCTNDETGAINISVTGGTAPYQYFWDNGATNEDIANIPAGEYTMEIVDANGCLAQESITISAPPNALQITNSTITNISAYQANDGSISLEISGGLEPYSIDWIRLSDTANVGNQNSISSLAADSYEVTVSDANGCTITETYLVTQPDVVEETIIQPSCSGFSDGSIAVLVNQGNGAFTYSWDTGETTNNITDLPPGVYTITITGFGDGPLIRTYTLVDPLPLAVDLGEDRTLCADQELVLDATVADETAMYTWTSDNGFFSAESMITVSTTGTYSVTVQTVTGCTTTGAVAIDVSTDEISAEFAVSSQVFVGETVVAVDISYPLPESMEWVLPEDAEILKQDSDEVELVFAEPGNYEIGIVTQLGNCTAVQTKSVLVVAKDGTIDEDDDNSQQQLIEDFIVYPNPSDGRFTADIKLTERGNISIKVFNLANNALMSSVKDRGETAYSIPFDISGLPSGVYAVLLETPYGNSLRKVILR